MLRESGKEQRWEPRRKATSRLMFSYLSPRTTCLGMALPTVGWTLPHKSTTKPRKCHIEACRSSSLVEVLSSQVSSLCRVGSLTSLPGMKQNISVSFSEFTGSLLFLHIFYNLECPSQFQLKIPEKSPCLVKRE